MKNTIYFDAEFTPLLLVNEEQVGSNSIVINIEADSTANQSLLITMDSGTTTSLTVTPGQENSLAIDEEYWSLGGSTFVSLVKGGLTSNSITLIFPETINTDAALEETSNLTYTMTGSNTVTEQIDNLDDRVTALEQGSGGNKIYTSTRVPTSSDTANEGDLWYQMNYKSSGAFDFPDWGYVLPIIYNPGSFKLSDVRSSLELRFYDTANDIYLYYLFLGGTNYSVVYNVLGPTNTFDGFDKDTGDLQVTTENEQGTTWSYWNYIPRWNDRSWSYLIANPLATGFSDMNMSPNIGTTTYNLYSILGYADYISSGRYRLDGFRLITNGFETSWQYDKANDYNVIGRWVYKENNWQVADYIAGEGVTIRNGIISANGSEIVKVNPIVTSGTQLAIINGKSIYAPTVSASQTQTSGTEIAEINVGNASTKLYAPETTVTQVLSSGTEIAKINGTSLYAPTGGGGGGGSGSGYTETSLWSGYKSDTGTISLNDSVENYDVVLIRMTSHPDQPSNSYYESYFTILPSEIIYNQHWQYNILVVRGTVDYGNGSMDCYFADSTSFVIEAINIASNARNVKPAVLEVIGLKFGGGGSSINTDIVKKYSATLTSSQYAWFTFVDEDGNTLRPKDGIPLFASALQENGRYFTGLFWQEGDEETGSYIFRIGDLNNSSLQIRTSSSTLTFYLAYMPYKVAVSQSMHHYSTDEQVVGTWIDGSTLYEKTQYGGITFSSQGTWYDTDITNIDKVVSVQGSINKDGEPINIGFWTSSIISCWILRDNTLKMTMQAKPSGETFTLNSITVQYTKTS